MSEYQLVLSLDAAKNMQPEVETTNDPGSAVGDQMSSLAKQRY
jgi:hypothetical protein